MEKIIGIFDEQTMYAERLKHYINKKKDIGCLAVSFREEQELKDFCDRRKLSSLLLGGSVAQHPEQFSLPYGVQIWVLSEEEPEQEEGEEYNVLFRYQKAGEIVRRMLLSEMAREERLSELYTVFSPEAALLATEYSDRLAKEFSQKGKTLLLLWDPFGGVGRTGEDCEGASISELLYLMRKDRNLAKQLFSDLPKRQGCDCFCGPEFCSDLWQYSADEMLRLVECCREYGGYRHVIFVAGVFHEGVIAIMNQSAGVYLAWSGTEAGEKRKQEFYRQMKYSGQQGVLSQISEVSVKPEVNL